MNQKRGRVRCKEDKGGGEAKQGFGAVRCLERRLVVLYRERIVGEKWPKGKPRQLKPGAALRVF